MEADCSKREGKMSRFKSDELAGSYFLTADFFLFFANPTTLMILDLVRKREMTSLAISRKLGIRHQTVLGQLRAMEREGILASSVRSKNAFYRFANSQISKAFEQILEFSERKLKETSRSPKPIQTHLSVKTSSSKLDSTKSSMLK